MFFSIWYKFNSLLFYVFGVSFIVPFGAHNAKCKQFLNLIACKYFKTAILCSTWERNDCNFRKTLSKFKNLFFSFTLVWRLIQYRNLQKHHDLNFAGCSRRNVNKRDGDHSRCWNNYERTKRPNISLLFVFRVIRIVHNTQRLFCTQKKWKFIHNNQSKLKRVLAAQDNNKGQEKKALRAHLFVSALVLFNLIVL